jgi:hypothetical protein
VDNPGVIGEEALITVKKIKTPKAPAATRGSRKPSRAKGTQTVAEQSGLTQRDVLLSGTPETGDPSNVIDRQFNFWMTMMRTSPWPSVLHHQIRLARTMMEFWLPTQSRQRK